VGLAGAVVAAVVVLKAGTVAVKALRRARAASGGAK
jgi:hypothetical protein